MKRYVILALMLCSVLLTLAQSKKIDSINILINKATSDTARINLMVKKSTYVRNQNIDSSIALAKKILSEAHRIGYYKGEVNTRNNLITSYCFKGDFKSAEENLKFLETFIKPSKDSADYADMYGNYGMMYGMQSKYDTSIQFYEKSIGINERHNNNTALPGNYSNIAIGFQQLSNFPQALIYQQKSLKLAEENKNESSQATTLVNMGITYTQIRDSARAEQAYKKSILLAKKNELINVELYSYTNLSSLYIKQSKWKAGYEYAMKAALLAEKMGDLGIQASSLSKAAVSLANTGEFFTAINLAQKGILIADSSKQPLNIYQGFVSMGNILKLQKKYTEAIPFYEKAFTVLNKTDAYGIEYSQSYKELSECYEETGNFNKALAAYKKYASIEDSVRSKDNIQKATELTMNYDFEKKQAIAGAVQARVNAESRLRQLLLLGGLLLALIVAIAGWRAFRNKQKANRILEIQKAEIQNTMTQLKKTQSQLIQSEKMASLGELTAGIAHEIQNPLNFVNNFSEINKEMIDEMQNELKAGNTEGAIAISNDVRDNEEKINHHGKRADAIVKGMLQHSRSSVGVKETTDINALCEEYLRLSYHGLRAKDKSFNATMKTDFDASLEKVNVIPQDIGRVILNLLTNAFYAVAEKKNTSASSMEHPYEPTVSISTKKLNDEIEIIVSDNGKGIPKNIVDKIFQPFFTTKPTGQGTGLGLSLSYDIVKAHGGEMKVETGEGEGSTFKIILPQ
ncbi:MAG: tetratricopeptide repeat protein [Ginsengibacter sp.]